MKSAISKRSKNIFPVVGAIAAFCAMLGSASAAVTNNFASYVYFPIPGNSTSTWSYSGICDFGSGPSAVVDTRTTGANRTIGSATTREISLSAFSEALYYTSSSTGGINFYGIRDTDVSGYTYFAQSTPFVMASPTVTTSSTITNTSIPITTTDPNVSAATASGTINILGFEYVLTDAGPFRALKVSYTRNFSYSYAGVPGYYDNETTTVWLRRGIGVVKEQQSYSGKDEFGPYTDTCNFALTGTNWRDYSRFLAANDLILGWPGYGVWKRTQSGVISQLHSADVVGSLVADLDGNGQGDIVVNFGSVYGLWVYMNGSATPTYIHGGSPDSMVAGNLDGDAKTDLVLDFGTSGLWKYTNNGTFTLVHSANPHRIAVGNTNGSSFDEIIADFGGSFGTFVYVNAGTTPVYLAPGGSSGMDLGDIDGDGKNDVIINFGPSYGVWTYTNFNGTSATSNSLIFANPSHMVSADLNSNGVQDVVMVIGTDIWAFYDGDTTPTYLRSGAVSAMTTGNYNSSSKPSLIVDFGPVYSTWAFVDNASWSYIHAGGTTTIASGDINKQ